MTAEHIVQIITAFAWPITVSILALLFRGEVRRAFTRLSALSYKDVKAEFEKDLHEAEGEVRQLLPKGGLPNSSLQEEYAKALSPYERLMRIAELSPGAAIMEAWREIEITIKVIADNLGLSEPNQMPGARNIKELVSKQFLPPAALGAYQKLRSLRTKAAHAADFAVDSEEAQRYIETAQEFHAALQFLLRHSEKE